MKAYYDIYSGGLPFVETPESERTYYVPRHTEEEGSVACLIDGKPVAYVNFNCIYGDDDDVMYFVDIEADVMSDPCELESKTSTDVISEIIRKYVEPWQAGDDEVLEVLYGCHVG